MNLLKLADKYFTDKGTNFFDKKQGEGHRYAEVYDLFLSQLKDDYITLLEIGVAKGASLCMWREYFKNAEIIGLDITLDHVDKNRALGVEGGGWPAEDNIILQQGSQIDPSCLDLLLNKYNFNIVIDDGSHQNEHQQFTFKHIWPHLKKGSIYIIEDIHFEKQIENSTLRKIFNIMLDKYSFECEYINVLYTNADSLTCIIKK